MFDKLPFRVTSFHLQRLLSASLITYPAMPLSNHFYYSAEHWRFHNSFNAVGDRTQGLLTPELIELQPGATLSPHPIPGDGSTPLTYL